MVFGILGLYDIIVLIFIVIMIMLGKYGGPAPQEEGDGNSKKNEGVNTADFVKDHAFDDDIPEVPFYKDIYEEHIPEMSSDREASSFHTKKYLNKSGRSGQVYDENNTISEEGNIIGSVRETDMTGHLIPNDKPSSNPRSNRMARSS